MINPRRRLRRKIKQLQNNIMLAVEIGSLLKPEVPEHEFKIIFVEAMIQTESIFTEIIL